MNTILGKHDRKAFNANSCLRIIFLSSASSLPTKKFIDPDACSVPFPEIAQQNVNLLLKNDSKMKN
jgi:hypothetical protein